jgi:hypothetical protein
LVLAPPKATATFSSAFGHLSVDVFLAGSTAVVDGSVTTDIDNF